MVRPVAIGTSLLLVLGANSGQLAGSLSAGPVFLEQRPFACANLVLVKGFLHRLDQPSRLIASPQPTIWSHHTYSFASGHGGYPEESPAEGSGRFGCRRLCRGQHADGAGAPKSPCRGELWDASKRIPGARPPYSCIWWCHVPRLEAKQPVLEETKVKAGDVSRRAGAGFT